MSTGSLIGLPVRSLEYPESKELVIFHMRRHPPFLEPVIL